MNEVNKINEFGVVLRNGIVIKYHHDQDCCEVVYADFKQLLDTTFQTEKLVDIKIEQVPGSGFRINGYFVPCYNQQNGYYSDRLELIVDCTNLRDRFSPDNLLFEGVSLTLQRGYKFAINITECNKNEIE